MPADCPTFAGATDTIYISRDFLTQNAGNSETVTGVLLEDIGHSIDWRLNRAGTPGDEGAFFSALVRGELLDSQQMQELLAEDNTDPVTLDEKQVKIEFRQTKLSSTGQHSHRLLVRRGRVLALLLNLPL
ncbi:hypothetical protein [Kamptonema formosum]|uniref:hypothetical protein n=1 Tax=Kamptonema formosum TaxID=331992 RepID=UPI000348AC44|nr:hypothetical protein [Oscillatoria sp. PCC 10802]